MLCPFSAVVKALVLSVSDQAENLYVPDLTFFSFFNALN